MSTRTEAFITPDVARWARERVGVSQQQVAAKINTQPNQIVAWERGLALPTLRQARMLARTLSIPFGYLYLSAPPRERLPIRDFRTVAGRAVAAPTPELLDVVNDVLLKQQWYREFLQEEGESGPNFVGRFTTRDEEGRVAADVSKTLDINENLRQSCTSWTEFLRVLIRRVEAAGVLVMRSGIVGNNTHRPLSVEDFRGFAISDGIAPAIFVNGDDALAAQIFTVIHELIHIWIGESGISNQNPQVPATETHHDTERFCNRVTAEVLIPAAGFDYHWTNGNIERSVQSVSRYYRVSSLVALRRAYDLGKLTKAEYSRHYRQHEERFKNQKVIEGSGGGDFYAAIKARHSPRFTTALVGALAEGKVLRRDAAYLLGVRARTLEAITEHILAKV